MACEIAGECDPYKGGKTVNRNKKINTGISGKKLQNIYYKYAQ